MLLRSLDRERERERESAKDREGTYNLLPRTPFRERGYSLERERERERKRERGTKTYSLGPHFVSEGAHAGEREREWERVIAGLKHTHSDRSS